MLYEPAGRGVLRLARWAGGLQTGNIRTYLALFLFYLNLLIVGDQLMEWLLAILETLLFIAAAPLLAGWIKVRQMPDAKP